MSDSANPAGSGPYPAFDRRSNRLLRSLVDEMLHRVREMSQRTSGWRPEERASAEVELEGIMSRVRGEVARGRPEP